MDRPPRSRGEGVIRPSMLFRAWVFLGFLSAGLSIGGFFFVLVRAGWHLGSATGVGAPLHHAYLEATTMTFLGIVACQVGTAVAARTDRASLRETGLTTNPLLLWGIAFEIAFAAAVITIPGLRDLFGARPPPAAALALLVAFPIVVWGADELRRFALRRRSNASPGDAPLGPAATSRILMRRTRQS